MEEEQEKIQTIKTDLLWTNNFFHILLISLILGIICGFIMVIFNYLLILFEISFLIIPYFLAPMIASLLTSLLVKYSKSEKVLGTGSSEFLKEIHNPDENYKRVPNLIAKAYATSWTYGSGMICGREGPGLLIGGNIGFLLSKKFKQDREDCSFIGAGACTAAILKAPISGALFCSELPYNNHIQYKSLLPSIIASIIAYFIFCIFFGFEPFIASQITSVIPNTSHYLTLFPLLALFGISSGLFVLIYINFLRKFMKKLKNKFKKKIGIWILPLIGGIFYCIFLLIFIPMFGEPYSTELRHPDVDFLSTLTSNIHLLNWIFLSFILLFILIAILLSIGTLNSAGIIMPLMIFGGLLGGIFGLIFYPENPELFILLGISAVLGAATNNPIAAIFIIVEMTWTPLLFIPAGFTTILAYIFSGPNSIIQGQRNIKLERDILDTISVEKVMMKDVLTMSPSDNLNKYIELFKKTNHMRYPVIEDNNLIGIISYKDVLKVANESLSATSVETVMSKDIITTTPNESLSEALLKIELHNHGHLPVVDPKDNKTLLGIISKQDIIRGHNLTRIKLTERERK